MVLDYNSYIKLITEKSSLTVLGIPTEVMKPIQIDYALSDDVEWERIDTKKEVEDYLIRGERKLFLQISINKIKVIVSHQTIKGSEYFVDVYDYVDDDWSGSYTKRQREIKSLNQIKKEVRPNSNIYMLDGEFSTLTKRKRTLIKKEHSHKEFNEIFKKEFLSRFDGILKRITSQGFKKAKGEIEEKAKRIAIENKMLIKSIENPLEGNNGLSILDEFLLNFEEAYSEYFDERIDLQELTEYFTREKVMTLLMYYIYRGKVVNQN